MIDTISLQIDIISHGVDTMSVLSDIISDFFD